MVLKELQFGRGGFFSLLFVWCDFWYAGEGPISHAQPFHAFNYCIYRKIYMMIWLMTSCKICMIKNWIINKVPAGLIWTFHLLSTVFSFLFFIFLSSPFVSLSFLTTEHNTMEENFSYWTIGLKKHVKSTLTVS